MTSVSAACRLRALAPAASSAIRTAATAKVLRAIVVERERKWVGDREGGRPNRKFEFRKGVSLVRKRGVPTCVIDRVS